MKTDLILLLNVLAMFVLSLCTDYWMYRSYKFSRLIPKLQQLNDTWVRNWNGHFRWQNFVAVQYVGHRQDKTECSINLESENEKQSATVPDDADYFGSSTPKMRNTVTKKDLLKDNLCSNIETRYLFSEFGNLFRECNDLLDGYREILHEIGLLYRDHCNYFLSSPNSWHSFRKDRSITVSEKIAIGFACAATATVLISSALGVVSSFQRNITLTVASGTCLVIFATFYSIAIIVFVVKLELVKGYLENQPEKSPQEHLISQHRTTRLGWSFVSAILCVVLTVVSSYVFFAHGRSMREHRKHLLRRRQLQAALMSSCRPDVALALRAKMTVKTSL